MTRAQVRMLASGAVGALGGFFWGLTLFDAWGASLGVLCFMWLAILIWVAGDEGRT
jgi:hypothetical protein